MIVINIIFWAFVILAFSAISIPFIILSIIGFRKRSNWMKWLGAVPSVLILGSAFCGFCLLLYGFIHPWQETTDPKSIRESFVDSFGFDPGEGFIPIGCKSYCLADSGYIYLKFQAPEITLEKIRYQGFKAIDFPNELNAAKNSSIPKWWLQGKCESITAFKNDTWKGVFHTNTAYLLHDTNTNFTYFYSEGVD
jgi:hypothetical protein